ncbi:hypothetical protein [Shewanella surugensis]|uniref:Uncharacterized protein n=1 Tax=Shewanella surugensis TaxID=212020 RepID=A0ABT0LFG8_9GAMM|nr:hypothetical protein [Shewanella surugensis]MCL1126410.1 hypothetical protein [Shewanella surugensis]
MRMFAKVLQQKKPVMKCMLSLLMFGSLLLPSLGYASSAWIPIILGDITFFIPSLDLDESVVYQDEEGYLYVKLSVTHGSKTLKLEGNKGSWTITEITFSDLMDVSLVESEYQLQYGYFSGDGKEDFKLVLGDGWEDLIMQNNGQSYGVIIYEAADDGTIGNIDTNGNGIRDDVEVEITKLYSQGNEKGYLEHVSFYTRKFLLDTDDLDKRRHFTEMLKGYACLSASAAGEDAYAKIVGHHLDSKARFNRYIGNQSFLNQQTMNAESMDCVLDGGGVEPVSGCFITEPLIKYGTVTGSWSMSTLMPGENVKLTLNVKHTQYEGKFDFSYLLKGVEQASFRVNPGVEHSFTIDNYLFENDGYLKVLADNTKGKIAKFTFTLTCSEN